MAAPTFVAATRPAVGWAPSATSRTTPSFSVTSGDILVVLSAIEDNGFALNAPTGGSLTWTQQEHPAGSNLSGVGIWTATAASTTSITVTQTAGGTTTTAWGFVVHQWRNAAIGAHTNLPGTAGTAPSLALTTTAANSAISYISADWSAVDGTTRTWRTINSVTPTSGNGLETDYFRDAGGTLCTIYVAYWSDVGATGAKTTGLTAPATQKPMIAVLEIKGTGAAAGPVAKQSVFNRPALMRSNLW